MSLQIFFSSLSYLVVYMCIVLPVSLDSCLLSVLEKSSPIILRSIASLSAYMFSSSGIPTGYIKLHLTFVSQFFFNIFHLVFSAAFWGISSDTHSNSLILTSVLSNLF